MNDKTYSILMLNIERKFLKSVLANIEAYISDSETHEYPYQLWQQQTALEDDETGYLTGMFSEFEPCTSTPEFTNRYKQFKRL